MKTAIHLATILFLLYGTMVAQTVQTRFGTIQSTTGDSVAAFLGIPFAKPPLGALRWQVPEQPDAWLTTLQTTAFKPSCPQKEFEQGSTIGTIVGNEDCLYLNVWTPQTALQSGATRLPVLVFIHGGGNQQGSASSITGGTRIYDGRNMARRGNAVIVTIQYRLGALGFLVHPGLEQEQSSGRAGNYAVLDQILALRWVRENITRFGGDTSRTMIFGESAGGLNVGNLLTSPLAAGLFQRACIQSAAPIINDYADSRMKSTAFVNGFVPSGTDVAKIAQMRTLSIERLLADVSSPISGGVVQQTWQPVVDGVVFPRSPQQAFESRDFNRVPLLIGSNADEMSLSVPPTVTPALFRAFVAQSLPQAFQARAMQLYPPGTTNAEARNSYIQLVSDGQFTASVRRTARWVAQNQSQPVWRYFFSYRHTVPQLAAFGSYHGMELFYVFNTWENATLGRGALFSNQDAAVQNAMLRYWVNFAATGNPNGTGLAEWRQFDAVRDCYMEIKAQPNGTQCGLLTAKSDFWDDVQMARMTTSVSGKNNDKSSLPLAFPNPANETLALTIMENTTVHLYNVLGQRVMEQFCSVGQHYIDIGHLAPGGYLLVYKGKNLQTARISIVR
ncbi:MAG: carboxylesterase family protein [Candidatus Kapabacteria bacterium]|nr:carboxylesterase family protein [Candidatus Kapabacteria bacterium]